MIILGIDPGTATTGYGVIRKVERYRSAKKRPGSRVKTKKELKCLAYGTIKTSPEFSNAERLRQLQNQLNRIIKKHQPDFLAVERLYFFKNAKTVISVAQAKGIVLLVAAKKKIPVLEFTPLQVKMTIVGYGRASKKQIQEMVKVLLHLEELPRPDDAADALGIAVCCANLLR